MPAYYNEIDPYAAQWLRNLIAAGHIAPGDVDERSIADVRPEDTKPYTQCHFFAGIGGWSHALRLAGWPDDIAVWTGSCPCQPFSLAGKQAGFDDARHLWPQFRRLIAQRRPAVVFGEQVASATEWLGLVRGDLEAMEYAVGAMPVEAASAGADHLRDRYWFVADGASERQHGRQGAAGADRRPCTEANGMADADQPGASEERQQRGGQQRGAGGDPQARDRGARDDVVDTACVAQRKPDDKSDAFTDGRKARPISGGPSDHLEWVGGADGKARRVKSGIRLLAHGIPGRVGLLRGFGNAIDPRPAAKFITASVQAMYALRP